MCCGAGGWSIPLIEDNWDVVGVDIKKTHYPGKLIIDDIKNLNGRQFKNLDLIIGSPPCVDFSYARYASIRIHGKEPDPENGLVLIREFERIVREAQPKVWLMENVRVMEKSYNKKPVWRFFVSKGGKRSLWGNIVFPGLVPDFRFKHKIRDIDGWEKTRWMRSFIPYNIARFVVNVVTEKLSG